MRAEAHERGFYRYMLPQRAPVPLLAVGVSNIISGTCTNYTPGAGLGPRLARRPSRFRRDGNEDSGP